MCERFTRYRVADTYPNPPELLIGVPKRAYATLVPEFHGWLIEEPARWFGLVKGKSYWRCLPESENRALEKIK